MGATLALAPFSASPVLNAIVAAPFGVFALVFLTQALGRLGDFVRRDEASHWELLHAPTNLPPDSPDETYTLSYATPIRHRIVMLSAGALLMVELPPIWLLDVVNPWDPSKTLVPAHPALRPLGTMMACMLIPFGALGGVLIVAALRSDQRAITAGPLGLEQSTRTRTTLIDWYEVEVIAAIVRHGKITGFRVTQRPQDTQPSTHSIYWPAGPATAGALSATSGEELAALVAQRSGKPIQAR